MIHCFGCKKSGDIIGFYAQMRKKGFYPAIIRLARFFKIKLKWQNFEGKDEDFKDYDYEEKFSNNNLLCEDGNEDDDDIPF